MARTGLSGETFSISFSDREMTARDGLALTKRMLDSLGFRSAPGTFVLPLPKSNRGHAPWLLIEPFSVAMWCRASRFVWAKVHGWLFRQILALTRVTLDPDSTVITCHGEQASARHGYNAGRRGRTDRENRSKVLKAAFGLEAFNLLDFWATEAAPPVMPGLASG